MNNNYLPIKCLAQNCEGVIVKLDGEEINIHRLEEMGICSGCHVRVVCAGDPCLLKINNKNICLRMNSLNEVFVCPLLK
jgi:Fe2+ transport system protein FeoA